MKTILKGSTEESLASKVNYEGSQSQDIDDAPSHEGSNGKVSRKKRAYVIVPNNKRI